MSNIRKHPPHIAPYVDAAAAPIARRIADLDCECSSEKLLAQAGATTAFLGFALALNGNRKWLLLPGIVGGFLVQHLVQGSCPAMTLASQLGFRSRADIDHERSALKHLMHESLDREAITRLEGEGGPALEPEDEYEPAASHQTGF